MLHHSVDGQRVCPEGVRERRVSRKRLASERSFACGLGQLVARGLFFSGVAAAFISPGLLDGHHGSAEFPVGSLAHRAAGTVRQLLALFRACVRGCRHGRATCRLQQRVHHSSEPKLADALNGATCSHHEPPSVLLTVRFVSRQGDDFREHAPLLRVGVGFSSERDILWAPVDKGQPLATRHLLPESRFCGRRRCSRTAPHRVRCGGSIRTGRSRFRRSLPIPHKLYANFA